MQQLPKKVKSKMEASSPPGRVTKDEFFTFEGALTDKDTGEPVADKPVDLYVNGVLVAQVSTDSGGRWSFTVTIPTSGTYSIYAEFPGDATTFGSSPESSTGWLVPAGLVVAGFVAWLVYRSRST